MCESISRFKIIISFGSNCRLFISISLLRFLSSTTVFKTTLCQSHHFQIFIQENNSNNDPVRSQLKLHATGHHCMRILDYCVIKKVSAFFLQDPGGLPLGYLNTHVGEQQQQQQQQQRYALRHRDFRNTSYRYLPHNCSRNSMGFPLFPGLVM